MGFVRLTFSQGAADELSSLLEAALAPPPPVPLTVEQRLSILEDMVAFIHGLLGAGCSFKWSDHAEFLTTGRSSPELRASFPISSTNRYPVLRLGPMALTTNDLVIALASAQFTTDETDKNTLIMTQIMLVGDPQEYDPVGPSRELTDINGSNITPSIHHDPSFKIGMLRAPANETAYLNFVARADSSQGTLPIKVDQDYGWMDCLVLKNFFA